MNQRRHVPVVEAIRHLEGESRLLRTAIRSATGGPLRKRRTTGAIKHREARPNSHFHAGSRRRGGTRKPHRNRGRHEHRPTYASHAAACGNAGIGNEARRPREMVMARICTIVDADRELRRRSK